MMKIIKKIFVWIQNNSLLSNCLGSIAGSILLAIIVVIEGVMTPMTLYNALINFNLLYIFLAMSIVITIYLGVRLIKRHWKEVNKERFEEFETITSSFERLFDSSKNPLIGFLEELDVEDSHLSRVQTPLKNYIGRSFRYYKKHLGKFNGSIEDFELLVGEFENIFYAYEDMFIAPLEGRRDEIAKNARLKKKFNRFVGDYEYLRRQYVEYGEKINRLFNVKIVRTDFDHVLPL